MMGVVVEGVSTLVEVVGRGAVAAGMMVFDVAAGRGVGSLVEAAAAAVVEGATSFSLSSPRA